MNDKLNASVQIFAYGSNLLTERMQARIAGAKLIGSGYVTHRRLAFHKSGRDGSAKADAFYTGNPVDRVWGVVYSMREPDRKVLDTYESLGVGYDLETLPVRTGTAVCHVAAYVARREAIDPTLKPYSWYLHFVLQGAIQQRLPPGYIRTLEDVACILDLDHVRHAANMRLASTAAGTRSESHSHPPRPGIGALR